MNNSTIDVSVLKHSPFLTQLPESLLHQLIEKSQLLNLETGQILIAEGSQPDCFYVVLDGDFEIIKLYGGQNVIVSFSGSGEILGEIALIENTPRSFTVKATRPSEVLKIDKSLFNDVILSTPSTALALLRTVIGRLRVAETMLRQQEKLASLGTLAAGLAHELNNPASAAQRSAKLLQKAINDWQKAQRALDWLKLEAHETNKLTMRLKEDTDKAIHQNSTINPLEFSDHEAAIQNWLEGHTIEAAWEIAPVLTAFGWNVSELVGWLRPFQTDHIPVILNWLAAGYNIHIMLHEITTSMSHISEIVAAVKKYTFMDQAPQKEIDIHEGLESTLVILKHKINPGIIVKRLYDLNLPHIEAYAGELNQLWTNLIDNAIDAMDGAGELHIRTYREKDDVVVEILDNGPGIPDDVALRLFEPFFTTKSPGKGTGLGLHVSYSIVQKHRGKIEIRSSPGETCFKVSLPILGDS